MVDPIGTCQALDLLTQDQLEQLFDESNGYLSKVDEIFDTVQIQEFQQNEKNNSSDSNNHANDDDGGGGGGGTANKKRKRRQHTRGSSVITDKKCLILDVDNTLIYVRHFMDEMRVGDKVKLGERDAIVIKITYRLDLEFSENPGQMSPYDHVLQSKDDSIPQRGEWFPDEQTKVAIIHQADPTGCVIKIVDSDKDDGDGQNEENKEQAQDTETDKDKEDGDKDEDEENEEKEENVDDNEIKISFLQNSDELSQLEPMMDRENYLTVTFMYGGYLVRIRPGLGQFLSLCNAKYDVILFTAADGSVYQGLLKQVHHILKTELTEQKSNGDIDFVVPHKLWQNVYFRSDCDEKYDEYGLPYRHKNLAKLGRELSQIVMVDDNPLSYRGFEPNSVRVAGFWGLSQPSDNELMQTLFPTLWTIADHKDVRYHLSGLGQPPDDVQSDNPFDAISKEKTEDAAPSDSDDDLLTRQRRHSRKASQKFLQHLKEAIVAENESLEASSTNEEEDEDEEDEEDTVLRRDQDESSPPIEQTPDDESQVDKASLSSISSNKLNEIEKQASVHEEQLTQQYKQKNNADDTSPFADNFDDIADKVVNKYTSMNKTNSGSNQSNDSSGLDILGVDPPNDEETNNNNNNGHKQLSNNELDDIFNTNNNNDAPVLPKPPQADPLHDRQITDSGIGNAGTLIFDNYDEDILYRDAYDSPRHSPESSHQLQKRPSVELELEDEDDNNHLNVDAQTASRGTAPNSPNEDLSSPSTKDGARHSNNEAEEEEEEETLETPRGGDYVLGTRQDVDRSGSISSNKGPDTQLLGGASPTENDNRDTNMNTDGFMSIEMGNTKSRPSRTPSPIDDTNAEILIQKSTGCSCFGWFGKKKKNKNIGLAQQELR